MNISERYLDMNAQMLFLGDPVMATRESVGLSRYFSKDTALALLKDFGLEVEGWFYTYGADVSSRESALYNLTKVLRKVFFRPSEGFTARVLGGYSLMVLAGC